MVGSPKTLRCARHLVLEHVYYTLQKTASRSLGFHGSRSPKSKPRQCIAFSLEPPPHRPVAPPSDDNSTRFISWARSAIRPSFENYGGQPLETRPPPSGRTPVNRLKAAMPSNEMNPTISTLSGDELRTAIRVEADRCA